MGFGLDHDKEQLECNYDNVIQKSENIFQLDLSIWQIAKELDIDLEALFYRIKFLIWKQMADNACKKVSLERMLDVSDLMRDLISKKENIRYRYFELKTIEKITTYGTAVKEYGTLHQVLQEFVKTELDFYLSYYSQEAFQWEMEMLPAICKAAVYLNEAFQREAAGDYRNVLLLLKEMVTICMELSETVQLYSHMYVEELKKQL